MSTKAFLGLDIGGTGAKAAVYDDAGNLLGAGQVTYAPNISPEGNAEIPIEVIYAAARDATRNAVRASGAQVSALAIASQGQTFTILDQRDQPLYPAILWYDSRAAEEASQMSAALNGAEQPLVEAIAVAPKILWLRRHYPELMAQAQRYLLLPDYLNLRLCGEAVTDPCTASTTALYIEGTPDYSSAALQAAQIEAHQLARIQSSGSAVTHILPAMADEWGLPADTQVVIGTNDQYAGALGAGNCKPGILSETTGTCLALVSLFATGALNPSLFPPGLLPGRFPIDGMSFALAYAKTAGLVVDWLTKQFAPGKTLAEMEALATQSLAGSRGVTVLPHFDGMVSPLPNAVSRGAILNLNLGHTLGDIYRAVLESIAYSLRENIDLMRGAGFSFDAIRSIGGGAHSNLWLQIKADVTGMQVERPAVTEAATLGAAMLAAVGVGAFATVAECSSAFYKVAQLYTPDAHAHSDYEAHYRAYRDLYSKLYV